MDANFVMKSKFSPKQMVLLQSEFDKRKRSKTTAYLLWFFTGGLGGHRFYVGDAWKGVLLLITLGGFLIGTLIDGFFIGKRVEEKNQILEAEILQQIAALDLPSEDEPSANPPATIGKTAVSQEANQQEGGEK